MDHKKGRRVARPSRHRRRLIGVQIAFVAAFGIISWRIHYVQHAFGPDLTAQANQVEQVTESIPAQRGALLDRNGHRLAYDVPAYFLDIRTESFKDLPQLANQLSPSLGVPADKVLEKLQTGSHWVRWPNPILQPAKDAIVKLMGKDQASDVTFTPTEQRFYPYKDFAANTLGFVDHSGTGQGGLEAEYNKVLSGTSGQISYLRDRWGFPIQTSIHTTKAAIPGQDLELTIDQTIQGFVEAKMNDLVKQYKPEHAAIIVADPNTGEILAMASRPTFDPNEYWNAEPHALSDNWAVNDAFEPGSTFKMLTLVAGLATHTITLDDTFMSGQTRVANHTIHDWNYVGWGKLDYRGALEWSSNVGFAELALKLHWPALLQYMQTFGFLDKTGIDLPAEGNSIIFSKQNRGQLQLATSGFGQGNAVTPIQQIQAYAAIANGGKLIQPHLVKALIDDATGQVDKTMQPKIVNPQVAPSDVIKQVNDTLVLDVSKGIDNIGAIPGYDVAGKTGTANTVDPKTGKYYDNRYDVSFIGYAPANAPKYEVMVTLDWPKTAIGNQWGSTIATPAARDILQQCLQYGHIAPSNGSGANTVTVKTDTHYVQTPNLVGQTIQQAQETLNKLGLNANLIGKSGKIQNQWPEPGIEVATGTNVYASVADGAGQSPIMPDLTGTTMREAGDILNALGLTMQANGSGFAVGQSVKAGQAVPPGTAIKVDFQPPKDPADAAEQSTGKTNSTG